jgi:hypothetical protein
LTAKFAILRRESGGGYSTRGPIAYEMNFTEAREEITRLKVLYPHQDFVIMGEIGEAKRSDRVTVKIEPPDLPTVAPRKKRKQAKVEGNVVAFGDQNPKREQDAG